MHGVDPLTASVLDSAAEGALLLDAGHRVLHANAAAARLLGREPAELVGHVLELPLPLASAEERWTGLDDASPGGEELEVLTSVVGVQPTRVVAWLRRRADERPEDEGLLDDLEELTGVGRWIGTRAAAGRAGRRTSTASSGSWRASSSRPPSTSSP